MTSCFSCVKHYIFMLIVNCIIKLSKTNICFKNVYAGVNKSDIESQVVNKKSFSFIFIYFASYLAFSFIGLKVNSSLLVKIRFLTARCLVVNTSKENPASSKRISRLQSSETKALNSHRRPCFHPVFVGISKLLSQDIKEPVSHQRGLSAIQEHSAWELCQT